jgi:hypothetical protein
MHTSGFSNAPITKALVTGIVCASLAASLFDVKSFFYIQVVPHFWGYGQWWRVLLWQTCYTNSTELLFAVLTFYRLRVIERIWGSVKFGVRSLDPRHAGLRLGTTAAMERTRNLIC